MKMVRNRVRTRARTRTRAHTHSPDNGKRLHTAPVTTPPQALPSESCVQQGLKQGRTGARHDRVISPHTHREQKKKQSSNPGWFHISQQVLLCMRSGTACWPTVDFQVRLI